MDSLNKKSNRGFSLIELLMVIGIIGILSGIVLASLSKAREKAKIVKARAEIKQIYNAFIMFESDIYEWPGHNMAYEIECPGTNNEICPDGCDYGLSDCKAGLICDDADDPYPRWAGPYIESAEHLKDPWGHEYFFDTDYYVEGKCLAAIGSYGPNGVGLNLYDSDDIFYIIQSD